MINLKNPKYKIEKTRGIPFTVGPAHSFRANSKRKAKKSNKLEIGVCCKTQKEHLVMLTLIVYIQHYYNLKFKKYKRVNLRRLVDCAFRDLEKRDKDFSPFFLKD